MGKTNKQITAAVFPTPEIARKLVRQDWLSWDLDGIFPMIYHNFYDKTCEWIGTAVKEDVKAINGRYPLYCGLYLPSINENELKAVINIALNSGSYGISLFDYNAFTNDRFRKIFQQKS